MNTLNFFDAQNSLVIFGAMNNLVLIRRAEQWMLIWTR